MTPLIKRRQALMWAGQGALATTITSALHSKWGTLVKAAPQDRRFLLYIHCGSWDGLASGLVQPNLIDPWPRGSFYPGATGSPKNPLMNQLTREGDHYFHFYSNPLKAVKDNLFQATTAPESLDHNVAGNIALSGAPSANPSWNAGFAQATRDKSKSIVNVIGGMPASTTPNVAFASANDLNTFRTKFSESSEVPTTQMSQSGRAAFLNVSAKMYEQHFGGSAIPVAFQSNLSATAAGWVNGIPELAANSQTVQSISAAMAKTKTDSLITTYCPGLEGDNIKTHNGGYELLRQRLILAGSLASSGYANGMSFGLNGEDLHAGGSGVITARSGAQLWVMLSQFWGWIKSQNMQNQVLVIVSHDFSRTAYNNNFTTHSFFNGTTTVTENIPGTDHGLASGVVALNGKIHASRMGGISGSTTGSYLAAGAKDLGGILAGDVVPTRQQVIGSLLMKAFPSEFVRPGQERSGRLVKAIWPSFDSEKDVLGALL